MNRLKIRKIVIPVIVIYTCLSLCYGMDAQSSDWQKESITDVLKARIGFEKKVEKVSAQKVAAEKALAIASLEKLAATDEVTIMQTVRKDAEDELKAADAAVVAAAEDHKDALAKLDQVSNKLRDAQFQEKSKERVFSRIEMQAEVLRDQADKVVSIASAIALKNGLEQALENARDKMILEESRAESAQERLEFAKKKEARAGKTIVANVSDAEYAKQRIIKLRDEIRAKNSLAKADTEAWQAENRAQSARLEVERRQKQVIVAAQRAQEAEIAGAVSLATERKMKEDSAEKAKATERKAKLNLMMVRNNAQEALRLYRLVERNATLMQKKLEKAESRQALAAETFDQLDKATIQAEDRLDKASQKMDTAVVVSKKLGVVSTVKSPSAAQLAADALIAAQVACKIAEDKLKTVTLIADRATALDLKAGKRFQLAQIIDNLAQFIDNTAGELVGLFGQAYGEKTSRAVQVAYEEFNRTGQKAKDAKDLQEQATEQVKKANNLLDEAIVRVPKVAKNKFKEARLASKIADGLLAQITKKRISAEAEYKKQKALSKELSNTGKISSKALGELEKAWSDLDAIKTEEKLAQSNQADAKIEMERAKGLAEKASIVDKQQKRK